MPQQALQIFLTQNQYAIASKGSRSILELDVRVQSPNFRTVFVSTKERLHYKKFKIRLTFLLVSAYPR